MIGLSKSNKQLFYFGLLVVIGLCVFSGIGFADEHSDFEKWKASQDAEFSSYRGSAIAPDSSKAIGGGAESPVRADSGTAGSERSTMRPTISKAQNLNEVMVVARFEAAPDGRHGLIVGSTLVGLFGVALTTSGTEFVKSLVTNLGSDWVVSEVVEFLAQTIDTPGADQVSERRYLEGMISIAVPLSLARPIRGDDILFLLEGDKTLPVGRPVTVQSVPMRLQGAPESLRKLISVMPTTAAKTELSNPDFASVSDMHHQLRPGIRKEFGRMSTIGLVNNYVTVDGRTYLMFHDYQFRVAGLSYVDHSIVAIDVTEASSFPLIGSVVYVEGRPARLREVLKQQYGWWYDTKVAWALSPTYWRIISGEYDAKPDLARSLLKLNRQDGVMVVAVDLLALDTASQSLGYDGVWSVTNASYCCGNCSETLTLKPDGKFDLQTIWSRSVAQRHGTYRIDGDRKIVSDCHSRRDCYELDLTIRGEQLISDHGCVYAREDGGQAH